jgi:hypothetical protein
LKVKPYFCNGVTELKKNKVISKFIAALLLLVLMLSITPKTFLHEVLADHKDAPSCNDSRLDGPCIHKLGYNCQQSDVVVPTVYLITETQEVTVHPDFCITEKFSYSASLTKKCVSLSHGRAPPALV